MCPACYLRMRQDNGELGYCLQDECEDPVFSRNLCRRHYSQWRRMNTSPCIIDGCDNNSHSRGYCNAHYLRWMEYGDPLAGAPRSVCAWSDCGKEILAGRVHCHRHAGAAWKMNNRDRCTDRENSRRAMKKEQFREYVDRGVVFRRDSGICGICGLAVNPDDWHLDHVIPLAQGGEHSYVNVQVSHPSCNIRKGAKILQAEEAASSS